MTDPAELLASQAEEIAGSDTIPVLRMAEILALWGEALTAVLNRHKPQAELVWPDPGETETRERHVCVECSGWGPYVDYPCPTVQAITTALEAK